MITTDEALDIIKNNLPDWGESEILLSDLVTGQLQEDILCDRDYPPFNRVMMDGIGISWAHYKEGKREFKLNGIIAAGSKVQNDLDPSECYEVMTGAPMPENLDLVIPYEHIEIQDGVAKILFDHTRGRYENIHLKGSDAKKGDLLLKSGAELNSPRWGIAASLGYSKLKIKRRPKINIISTGDELIEVGEVPLQHQIRRSNAYALKSSLKSYGYNDVVLSHLPDKVQAIREHYEAMKNECDLLIYSGGVSKGKFDFLPQTLQDLGVKELFHGISQRPGKPLWFGIDEISKTAVLGLPGNPVSSLVCLHKYFLTQTPIYVKLLHDVTFNQDLTYFAPVKLHFGTDAVLTVEVIKIKNSGEFSALAESSGFIELPRGKNIFKAQESYLFYPWIKM